MSNWTGKGSRPRPLDPKKWSDNYEAIFGQKQKKPGTKHDKKPN